MEKHIVSCSKIIEIVLVSTLCPFVSGTKEFVCIPQAHLAIVFRMMPVMMTITAIMTVMTIMTVVNLYIYIYHGDDHHHNNDTN